MSMSLFGGESSGLPSSSQASDFSISTIDDGRPAAHSQGAPDTNAGREDYTDHDGPNDEQAGGGAQESEHEHEHEAEEEDERRSSRSPSAISETSDAVFRPNRFRGSDRAWLHHTHQERALARSLDQLSADDLSLHLYSAHHLKARLRSPASAHTSSTPWGRKSRWFSTNHDIQKPWYPDSDWTAWPLAPSLVPSGNETFGQTNDGLDAFTLRANNQPSPPDNLRQQLYAFLLVRANHSWKSNNQSSGPISHPVPARAPSPLHRRRTRSVSAAPSLPPSSSIADELPLLSSLDHSIVSQHDRRQDEESEVKNEDEELDENKHIARPVFSADDDRSHTLLHPTISHVMSKLDKLLLALHQSRHAHSYRAKDGGDTSDSSARSTSRSRSASNRRSKRQTTPAPTRQTRRTTRSASRQSDLPDYAVFDDSGEDESYEPEKNSKKHARSPSNRASSSEPEAQTMSPSGRKRQTARKPGLRDWSEVLGIAALTGWNSTAIERARQRCSDLFGEDMNLYNMPEHADSSADESEPANQAQTFHSSQLASWRCPFVNCFRHMQPLNQGFRWREHMRKTHKYDKDQISTLEQQLIKSGDITSVVKRHRILAHNPRNWQPPDPLKCPHCPNYNHVFPKVTRLLDHIRRSHKYDPRIQDLPEVTAKDSDPSPDSLGSGDEDSDDYMVGGVHNDGFLQPVLRHAGIRGKDLEQRATRANARRSKAELKNVKKQKLTKGQEPSPSLGPEDTDMGG